LALLLGIGVRIAVIPMIFTMCVAIYTVHWGAFGGQNNGMEFPLTLAVVLLSLGLTGPGRLSVSAMIRMCACKASAQSEAPDLQPQQA
jgi:putative oxidoreductase